MNNNNNTLSEQRIHSIIQTGIQVVQAWDDDPMLLAECRLLIPFTMLQSDDTTNNKFCNTTLDTQLISNSTIFIQRFVKWFQQTQMTWINKPNCTKCNTNDNVISISQQTSNFTNEEEREGQVSCIEVYQCTICHTILKFPRYNSVRKLLQTRSGRCGEYANLFGLFCRACGYITRYIMDTTDHVWNEIYIPETNEWIMIDSCEGIINENSMYEVGWNTSLSLIIAFTSNNYYIIDITSKYTRQYNTIQFQQRRKEIVSNESMLRNIINQYNTNIIQNENNVKVKQQINNLLCQEQQQLQKYSQMNTWDKQYANGRISGSLTWRQSRNETTSGSKTNNNENDNNTNTKIIDFMSKQILNTIDTIPSFIVEPFTITTATTTSTTTPTTKSTCRITVRSQPLSCKERHSTIQVSINIDSNFNNNKTIVSCAMNIPNSISVVVLDYSSTMSSTTTTSKTTETECVISILQSKSCTSIYELYNFISSIPKYRIVILHGKIDINNDADNKQTTVENTTTTTTDNTNEELLLSLLSSKYLGGLDTSMILSDNGIMYIGQIMAHPDWVICQPIIIPITQNSNNNNTTNDETTTSTGTTTERTTSSPSDTSTTISIEANIIDLLSSMEQQQQQQHHQQKEHNDIKQSLQLRTFYSVKPTSIIGRLYDDSILTLEQQIQASYNDKRIAFLSYMSNSSSSSKNDTMKKCCVTGYTTKPNCPIYLLGSTSYPFHSCSTSDLEHDDNNTNTSTWNSFLLLPSQLVDPSDVGIVNDSNNLSTTKPQEKEGYSNGTTTTTTTPQYEIPLNDTFFIEHVGQSLLQKHTIVSTVTALQNCRLIGLYFSAHWCGPCRSFTPMLAEMYETIKNKYPSYGLEIIFVSSDRDVTSFTRYYDSMPWLAIPFDALNIYKQLLSMKYGVRGIPSFVVLDSITGEIVVSTNQSRQEITTACQRGGDAGIIDLFNNWLLRVPPSSIELISMLEVSCTDDTITNTTRSYEQDDKDDDDDKIQYKELMKINQRHESMYLISNEYIERQERIKELKNQLIEDGMDEDEAVETAVQVESLSMATDSEDGGDDDTNTLQPGPLNGIFRVVTGSSISASSSHTETFTDNSQSMIIAQRIVSESGVDTLKTIVTTLLRYMGNVIKAPWTTKFRSFNLSNKVADRITSAKDGILLLKSLGMDIYGTNDDFVASFAFDIDLDILENSIKKILELTK